MELRTRRLLLRELDIADAEAANRYERDPEVTRYQSNDVCTLDESRDYIVRSLESARAEPRRVFDLAVTRDGAFIGRAGLDVRDALNKQGMLWWVIDPAHQNQGFATEAAAALVDFGFELQGLHRIYVDVDPRNVTSIRVAEKLGMKREAHLRENAFLKGEWVDSMILGILDREWVTRAAGR
ncbi:MAG: GNAT family N-acetyltransferase [Deltaproteobacteria bacterium]|nr:GNAT family N-acetyltransferase [Deltaproteobacteria bacterium]